jgi:hypothetical protein
MSLITVSGCINNPWFVYFLFEIRKQQQLILEGNNVIHKAFWTRFHHIVYKHTLGPFLRWKLERLKEPFYTIVFAAQYKVARPKRTLSPSVYIAR